MAEKFWIMEIQKGMYTEIEKGRYKRLCHRKNTDGIYVVGGRGESWIGMSHNKKLMKLYFFLMIIDFHVYVVNISIIYLDHSKFETRSTMWYHFTNLSLHCVSRNVFSLEFNKAPHSSILSMDIFFICVNFLIV